MENLFLKISLLLFSVLAFTAPSAARNNAYIQVESNKNKSKQTNATLLFLDQKRVNLGFCTHVVQPGEWIAKIIRTYGYVEPFRLQLVQVAKKKNDHILNINQLKPGDKINIPLLYISLNTPFVEEEYCQSIFAKHKKNPFLVRGPNSKYIEGEHEILFYSGLTSDEYQFLTKANSAKERGLSSVSERVVKPPLKLSNQGEVVFSFGGLFDSYHGQETSKTVISSELQPSLNLGWYQLWSNKWHSFVGLNYNLKKYNSSITPGKELKTDSITQGEFLVGGRYQWEGQSFLKFSLGASELLYYRQESENIFSLEKEMSFLTELEAQKKLFIKKSLSLGLVGQVRYYSQGFDVIGGGLEYGLGLQLNHKFKNSDLGWKLMYRLGEYETIYYDYQQRSLFMMFNYKVGF